MCYILNEILHWPTCMPIRKPAVTHLLLSALIARPLNARRSPPVLSALLALAILHTSRGAVQTSDRSVSLEAPSSRARRATDRTAHSHAAGALDSAHHTRGCFHAPRRPVNRDRGGSRRLMGDDDVKLKTSVIADVVAESRRRWDVDWFGEAGRGGAGRCFSSTIRTDTMYRDFTSSNLLKDENYIG